MSLHLRGYYAGQFCFPRVSGDEPTIRHAQTLLSAFSPRERG